jgi:Xaa-Pro aminopeptidase
MDIATDPIRAIRSRLEQLRACMAAEKVDTWIALSSDPHLSEYLPGHWQSRQWLSGFAGSAGTLVVEAQHAGLWVDSRYWVEAETCLAGTGIEAVRAASSAGQGLIDAVASRRRAGEVLALDGQSVPLSLARSLQAALAARGARLRTDLDLPARIWQERPPLPTAPVSDREGPFESQGRREKLAAVRAAMASCGLQWHLVSTLDDIAWLFNLRGSDVPYNPVFVAHALIGPQDARLFVTPGKVGPELAGRLAADGVTLHPYAEAPAALAALPATVQVLIDPRRVTHGLVDALQGTARTVDMINPSTLLKSRKGPDELAHIRSAMVEDGAALCAFFAWLEAALAQGQTITEFTIDERITAERAARRGFVSPSFGTIAAFGPHGALPHYRAEPEHVALICDASGPRNGLLLIDSGGQYAGGTTDITRMVAVGQLGDDERRDVTRVLQGMIQLSRARFPRGTRAPMLDALARAPIWADRVDYGHGTGHGVGYFLNVHEGPHAISPLTPPEPPTAFEPGMITSNEPGIYRPGRWGVRIENLLATVPAGSGEFGEFLAFETLTLCPIDRRTLEPALLRPDEIAWLDAYHREVRERLAPATQGAARAWLERATAPLAPSLP